MPLVLGKALGAGGRVAFRPESLPPALVTGLALAPPVLAGLLLFRLPALLMLALALALGGLAHLAARIAKLPLSGTPVLPAVVAVALIGPGASILWTAAAALAASGLELARSRFTPGARLQAGMLAYAAIFLIGGSGPAAYLRPGTPGLLEAEPIRLWLDYFGAGAAPVDPIRLYVGNVPGPVFATSLLAVAVGAAWLWYARRLSLLVLFTFVAGALLPIDLRGWNPGFQLDSGPLWFGAALLLADRRLLPASAAGRPLLGLAAGVVALALRARGLGIESALLTIAGLQVTVALVEGAHWLAVNRRRVWTALRAVNLEHVTLRLNRRLPPS